MKIHAPISDVSTSMLPCARNVEPPVAGAITDGGGAGAGRREMGSKPSARMPASDVSISRVIGANPASTARPDAVNQWSSCPGGTWKAVPRTNCASAGPCSVIVPLSTIPHASFCVGFSSPVPPDPDAGNSTLTKATGPRMANRVRSPSARIPRSSRGDTRICDQPPDEL